MLQVIITIIRRELYADGLIELIRLLYHKIKYNTIIIILKKDADKSKDVKEIK